MENDKSNIEEYKIHEKVDEKKRNKSRNEKERELNIFYESISSLKSIILMKPKLQKLVIVGQPEIISAEAISGLKGLKELWIVECCLKDVTALKKCVKLEKLYLYTNEIHEIPDLSRCTRLKILSLARNKISDIQQLQWISHLQDLNLADNEIRNIPNIFSASSELVHVNLSRNPLHHLQDIENLCGLTKVQTIEFGDPIYGVCPLVSLCNYRRHIINRLPSLQEIDYYPIGPKERANSFNNKLSFDDRFWRKYLRNGCLNSEIFTKNFSPCELVQITHLTMSKCSILEVNLADISLPCLESLDLSYNQISSLRGLQSFANLHTLCLSHNELGNHTFSQEIPSAAYFVQKLPKLMILFADHNKIRSIADLELPMIPSLKYLFLQHNKINKVNGIEEFPNLVSVVLDHNKIENIAENEFCGNRNIRTLLIENNRLASLRFTKQLLNIEKLFVANNKITDQNELEHLGILTNLKELTIQGNPLSNFWNHWNKIRKTVKSIKSIDGNSASEDN